MNLENTNSYGFNSQPIQISLRQNKPPDITSVETPVEPNSPLTVPSDSFVKSLDNEGVLVAGMPTWNVIAQGAGNLFNQTRKALNSTGEAIGDLLNGKFKAYKLGPLVGGSTQKAKDITDHLNFLNSGNPSTVTIGYDKSLTDKITEKFGGGGDAIPSNLYFITADTNGNLTAYQPRYGTANNVVGVALKNPDGRIDIIRITGDSNIGLRKGANGTALFSQTTQFGSGISTTLKTRE
jgi:hypothetical protein